jgi:Flp pilus assembly pilin Flp
MMWKHTTETLWSGTLELSALVMLWVSRGMGRLRRVEAGQSMVEYAIVVALIALIAMAAVQAFGNGIAQVFQQLLSKITSLGS